MPTFRAAFDRHADAWALTRELASRCMESRVELDDLRARSRAHLTEAYAILRTNTRLVTVETPAAFNPMFICRGAGSSWVYPLYG